MPGRTLASWYGSGSNPTEHNYQSLESSIYSQSSQYTGSNQNDQDHQYDTGYGYHPVNQGNSTPHYPEQQRRAFSPNFAQQPSSYTPPSPVPNNYQFSQHLSLSLSAPTSHGMNYSNSQQHQAALYASGPSPSHYGAASHGYSPSNNNNNSNAGGGPQWQQQTAQHHPGTSPQHSSVLTASPSASSPSPAHTPSPLHSPPPSQTMSGQYPAHHHGRLPPMGSPSQSTQGHNLSSWSHHGVGQGQGMNIHPGGMMSGPPPQGPGYYPAPHPSLIGPGRGPQGPPQHAHMASSGDRRSPLPAPGHWNSVGGGPATKPSLPHGPPPPSSHPQQNSSLGNAGGGNPLFSLQMLVNQEMNRNAAAAVMQANSYRGPAASMVHQQETVDLSQTSSSAENYSRLSPQQTGPIPLTRSDKQPLPEQASVRNGSIIASTTSSSALANTSATSPPTPLNGEVSSDSGIGGNANSVSAAEVPISSSGSTIPDTSKPKTVDLPESKPLTKESVSVIAQAPVREKPAPSPQIMTTSPPPVVEKAENIKQESEITVVKVVASETDKEVAPVQKESPLPKAAEDNAEKASALVISSTSDVTQTSRESAVSSSNTTTATTTTSFAKQPDDTLSIPSPASKDSTSPVRSPKSGAIKRTKKVDSILENLVESGTKKFGGAVSTALTGEQAPQIATSSATPVVVAPASVIVSPVTTSEDSSSGLGHEASAASPGIQQKPPPEQHKSPIPEEDAVSPVSGGDDSENGKPRRKRKLDKPHRLSKAPGEGDGEKGPSSEPDLTPKDENSQKSEDGTLNEGNQESKEELIAEESPSSTTNMDQEAPSKPIETITVDVINGQSADEKTESNRRRRSSEGSAASPSSAWPASGQRMRRKSASDRQEDNSNNGDLLAVLVTEQSEKNSLGDSKPEVKNAFIEVETELEKMFAGIVETEECVDPLKLDTASPIPMEVSPTTKALDSLTNIDSTSTAETKQVSGTKARGRPKGSRTGPRRSSESIFGPSSTDSTPKKKKKKLGKRQADESPSSSQQQKKTKRAKLYHGDFAGDIPFPRKKNLMKSELSCRDGSLQSASLYDSGSNTSTTRSRGPVVHIEGPRDNPYHVSVINTPIRGEDEDGGERGSSKKQTGTAVRRKNASYHNDLEYRGKVTASGATGTAMFSSTLSARYDAHTTDRTWICVFCKRGPHCSVGGGGTSGDLFGPYLLSTPDKLEINGDGSADERDITEEQKRSGGRNKRSLRGAHMVEQFCQKMSRKVRRSHSQDNAPVLGMVPVASTGTTEEEGCYEVWVHEECAVWAAGVHVVGSRIVGLQEAVWSAVRTICSKCGEGGANVGCVRRGCEWRLHYGCAREQGWELDEESYVACCTQHKKGVYSSEEAILPT